MSSTCPAFLCVDIIFPEKSNAFTHQTQLAVDLTVNVTNMFFFSSGFPPNNCWIHLCVDCDEMQIPTRSGYNILLQDLELFEGFILEFPNTTSKKL